MFPITWNFSSDIDENTKSKLKDTFRANDQLKRHLGCLCEIPDVYIYAKSIDALNVKFNLSVRCNACNKEISKLETRV